jgi:acyl-CoA synthetase (AMP-forming)/AMP-acid ligase II
MSSLCERIRAVLSLDPSADAVEFEGRWHSWGELGAVASALDAALGEAGLGPHVPVGLLLRNTPDMIGAMLGTLASQRCIVTLNPHQGDAKLAHDVGELRAPVIVAHAVDWRRPGFLEAARESGALGLELDAALEPPLRPVPGLERIGRGPHRAPSAGVAVEMLTSGTTGPPKRIQLGYAAFERTIAAAGQHYRRKGAASGDTPRLSSGVAIVNAPFVHMSGLFRTLQNVCEGRRIALLERFRVDSWLDLVKRHQPKTVALVPAALQMVLEADVERSSLASIQVVTSGSAKLDPGIQLAFERRYGISVLPSYGATEFAGGVAGWTLPLHREWGERKRGSVGRPQPGRELRVVDPANGQPVASDAPGLLEILSDGGWVRTTDLARIDTDGFLWILGRADDAIVRGGFKIMPADVVRVLVSHPSVREASVVGIADARLGQVPAAAVELRSGASLSCDELLSFARQHLTAYQMPAQLRIVEALPRTPSLKVSQPEVQALFGAGSSS